MPIYNKFFAAAVVSTLLAAPVFADGVPGQVVNRGPAPLTAHGKTMTPPEPGCVMTTSGHWSCPVPDARFTDRHRTTTTTHHHAPAVQRTVVPTTRRITRSAPMTTTRTVTHAAPTVTRTTRSVPTTTRTVTRSAPTTRRVATTNRTVSAPAPARTLASSSAVTLDMGAFTGGVGNGVGGGFFGGGGTVFFGADQRFSGVLQAPASRFTFQQRRRGGKKGHHGHHGHPGKGGCGC